ncbi:MAG: DUF445 family protein [Gemmatimonadales bacterium]|nr:DUF445 family protein [Gemmatimonadales bacterium]
MPSPLLEGAVTIGVGAVSGGVTNAIAIWMLFHPYEPVTIGPFTIQGAIPKNKARLARAIGKTVGEKLLTAEDLSGRLQSPRVRAQFDAAVGRVIDQLLEADLGSLQREVPAALRGVLADPDTRAEVHGTLKATVQEVVRPLSLPQRLAARALLTDALLEKLLEGIEREGAERLVGLVTSPAFRARLAEAIGDWLAHRRPHTEGEAPSADAAVVLRREASEAMWRWATGQVPVLVQQLDVPGMVEQKVLGFSTERMEQIIRDVTERELTLIVRLGYWLGGVVGLLAFLLQWMM